MTGAIATALAALTTGAALLLLVPVGALVLQAVGYLLGRGNGPRSLGPSVAQSTRFTVLMPAHNEAPVIARTIALLLPQLRPGDRLLVIADNCTDNTADLAQSAGAEVTVRTDASRHGKGYALDWGIRRLEPDPPDAVIVIDSDCEVEAGSLQRLASLCIETRRPVQASNLMELPDTPTLKLRVAAFAWLLKTQLRTAGYHRLGLPCQLMGTGMAFPWNLISTAQLASSNIVEDVQLGVDLAISGSAPMFCEQAVVRSWFANSESALEGQHRRWELGHLSTLRSQVPRLLSAAVRDRRPQLAAIAWDLSVPPLALLVVLQTLAVALTAATWSLVGAATGLMISLLGVSLLIAVIVIAWQQLGYRVISLGQMLGIPGYILGKLPMYLRLLAGRREVRWERTERDKPKS